MENNQAVILISFNGATAYQSYDNQRVPLSTGVLDLSLVSVNSTINYDNPTEIFDTNKTSGADYWLVLSIRSEKAQPFEMALPAAIPIERISDREYSIPSPTLADAFIELELPEKYSHDDKQSFDVILGSYASLPVTEEQNDLRGKLCLVDTQDGHVLGSLDAAGTAVEDSSLAEKGNEKQPVVVDLPEQPQDHLKVTAAKDPSLMIRSSNYVSQAIVGGGNLLGKGLAAGSSTFVARTKAGDKPLVFSENQRKNAARVHNVTGQVANVSAKTAGMIADSARGVGAYFTGKGKKDDERNADKKPGFLNRAFMAADNVFTSVEQAGKTLINDTSMATSVMVAHKYGQDAGQAVRGVGDSVHNAALVYIDVRGISRRALIKSAGKGALFGNKQSGSGSPSLNASPTPPPALPPKK